MAKICSFFSLRKQENCNFFKVEAGHLLLGFVAHLPFKDCINFGESVTLLRHMFL